MKSEPVEKEQVMNKLRIPSFKPRITVRPKREIGVPKVRVNKGLGGLAPKVRRY